jgi:hypothetical protein
MNWSIEKIDAFYIERKLLADMDIMTELDGYKILKNTDVESENAYEARVHVSMNEIKLDIPKPDFTNSDLHFIC